jgi:hypothetical protein
MRFTLKEIIEVVCWNFEVDITTNKLRTRNVVDAKKAYAYFARKYTFKSHEKIGEAISHHHATIIHHERSYPTIIKFDNELQQKHNKCMADFKRIDETKDCSHENIYTEKKDYGVCVNCGAEMTRVWMVV